jgi:hypothetical protein
MGSGVFPDFSILFICYSIYVFSESEKHRFRILSISIEILTAIVSFGSRSTQANFLSV